MDFPVVSYEFLESLYAKYETDPDSVSEDWKNFFNSEDLKDAPSGAAQISSSVSNKLVKSSVDKALYGDSISKKSPTSKGGAKGSIADLIAAKLIEAYNHWGWKRAHLNPIFGRIPTFPAELDPTGWEGWNSDASVVVKDKSMTLGELWDSLEQRFKGTISAEWEHLELQEERDFMRDWFYGEKEVTNNDRQKILGIVSKAVGFEEFLHKKYRTMKRFGADGGESLLVVTESILNSAADYKVKESVISMAHRGRLNVISSILNKPYVEILKEFQEKQKYYGQGDVKYHMGFNSVRKTDNGEMILDLLPNPSHLESINAVANGHCKARIDCSSMSQEEILHIEVHGDASIAGQGCVYENACTSRLEGYEIGGSIHIVHDNQVGFTADTHDTRSWPYGSQIAKMNGSAVIHINGDDPEAAWLAGQKAVEFRQKFKKDIFINMVCYRRFGHNEGDEPAFTQPILYSKIRAHPSLYEIYKSKLLSLGFIKEGEADAIRAQHDEQMLKAFDEAEQCKQEGQVRDIEPMKLGHIKTALDVKSAIELIKSVSVAPEGFNLHKNIDRIFKHRKAIVDRYESEKKTDVKEIDWALGEALAFACVTTEGGRVRLSGQDSKRGTFSHRHAVIRDQENGKHHCMFKGDFEAIDSPLSEESIMGFEYGYSTVNISDGKSPRLSIWEAQFGDFANGAQVIIDQYVTSAEEKWNQKSNIALFLPHGYDGQGPEHSSGRIERFLQSASRDNIRVAYTTTPANHFHLLREQAFAVKPLVVMTPKFLLRYEKCVSSLKDFEGKFKPVISTEDHGIISKPDTINKLVLCSGKVFYDLLEANPKNVLLCSLDQIYPYPTEALSEILSKFKKIKKVVWCQEEPENMGSWFFVRHWIDGLIEKLLNKKSSNACSKVVCVARSKTPSPATGFAYVHKKEQAELIEKAFKV